VKTWDYAAVTARLQEPRSCKKVKLIDTKVINVEKELVYSGSFLMEGRWTEIWTFNKCGTKVKVRVVFSADGKGTADVNFSAE